MLPIMVLSFSESVTQESNSDDVPGGLSPPKTLTSLQIEKAFPVPFPAVPSSRDKPCCLLAAGPAPYVAQ